MLLDSINAPVTSVAKCMTFARCSTNGVSGIFVEEQKGSSASATERTAYSCSSRSLDERASDPANAKSRSSSPDLLIVPARTREVTIPRFNRSKSSGVAPINPATLNTHVDGYAAESLCSAERSSIF